MPDERSVFARPRTLMAGRQRIKIVGGGFCGTMVLWHLMQRENGPPLDIAFYDEHGRHGRGVAYSTPYREHLLNVPAGGMSALPHDPDHFLRWLGQGADRTKFYPRMVYGDYLCSLLAEAQAAAARKGHTVTLHNARTNAEDSDDAITILATGTSQPLWPGGDRPEDPRFIENPYQPYAIPPDARTVIILGTGLSAVDAIMTLHHSGYDGDILCVSRHGLWPLPHGPKSNPWHWRKYVDALRPHSNRIWQAMPAPMRRFCLRRITYWNVIRHRMPRECFETLQNLRSKEKIRTLCGRVTGVSVSPSGLAVKTQGATLNGDLVINCLGFIQYNQRSATSFHMGGNLWTLGAALFGQLIETTAVPELRTQAEQIAHKILD